MATTIESIRTTAGDRTPAPPTPERLPLLDALFMRFVDLMLRTARRR